MEDAPSHQDSVRLRTMADIGRTTPLRRPATTLSIALFIVGFVTFAGSVRGQTPAGGTASETTPWIAFLERHCASCHSGSRPRAGFSVKLGDDPIATLRDDAEVWQLAIDRVRRGEMPPEGRLAPSEAHRDAFIVDVARALRGNTPNPGRPVLRRLGRVEFENTIRDLLGVEFDADVTFPSSGVAYGFDNVGDVLFVSPALIEGYFDASQAIIAKTLKNAKSVERLDIAAIRGEDEATRRRALGQLLSRAFRRPATEREIAARSRLFLEQLRKTASADDAVDATLQSVLLSPHFLYRVEEDRSGNEPFAPVSDHELAVRLSYFLWATMPDEELVRLADAGTLNRDDILREQVKRMLDDDRSKALATNFAAQWLGFREIRDLTVDFRRFPAFKRSIRNAMWDESILFFDDLVKRDLSLLRLIDSSETFLNAKLARHYEIDGLRGDEMRRVKLPNRRRGGVLGMGAVLTSTSYPLRTSPVKRGLWILDRLLGEPPPPPPPNVGMLPADDKQKDGLTVRQRLERHRRDPSCASCHARMDPLGFALENYDGIGVWREHNHGRPVETKSTLPDGTEIAGPTALRDYLLGRADDVVRAQIRAMMIYALGRGIEPSDADVVDGIVNAVAEDGYRMRTMIREIIFSLPFRYRRGDD